VRPTVVRDISEGNPLVDEETFGPVRPVIKYTTVEETVRRANNTGYGLGGSVWAKDVAPATAIAGQLGCGTARVNQHLGFGPHIPFGGIKQSGFGVEFSPEGVKEFTGVHVVSIAKS
jgi:acyl-CoA reductase-like NAD-dependent aldehyde dehydrogenase